MPVRLLTSSVLVWPKKEEVDAAIHEWAQSEAREHPELTAVGYFGSYARGDWGVGSDLDVILVVERFSRSPSGRAFNWDGRSLPVPVDFFIYNLNEWKKIEKKQNRFSRMLVTETRWVYRHKEILIPEELWPKNS